MLKRWFFNLVLGKTLKKYPDSKGLCYDNVHKYIKELNANDTVKAINYLPSTAFEKIHLADNVEHCFKIIVLLGYKPKHLAFWAKKMENFYHET